MENILQWLGLQRSSTELLCLKTSTTLDVFTPGGFLLFYAFELAEWPGHNLKSVHHIIRKIHI